ncbi:MAG: hypothetical protein ACP5GJ_03915 [Nanopusillaceae archaeon]|jgi:hypothetical protein
MNYKEFQKIMDIIAKSYIRIIRDNETIIFIFDGSMMSWDELQYLYDMFLEVGIPEDNITIDAIKDIVIVIISKENNNKIYIV